MYKQIKCPKFLSKTNGKFYYINCANDSSNIDDLDNNFRNQFKDKEERKKYLLEHCCGDYKNCIYYKVLEENQKECDSNELDNEGSEKSEKLSETVYS